jgi:hypothetical protein
MLLHPLTTQHGAFGELEEAESHSRSRSTKKIIAKTFVSPNQNFEAETTTASSCEQD